MMSLAMLDAAGDKLPTESLTAIDGFVSDPANIFTVRSVLDIKLDDITPTDLKVMNDIVANLALTARRSNGDGPSIMQILSSLKGNLIDYSEYVLLVMPLISAYNQYLQAHSDRVSLTNRIRGEHYDKLARIASMDGSITGIMGLMYQRGDLFSGKGPAIASSLQAFHTFLKQITDVPADATGAAVVG